MHIRTLIHAAAILALGAALVHPAPAPQAAGFGLVGYWKLDEAAGPAADSSGNAISGAWVGTPTPTAPGAPGITFNNPNCLTFDGTDHINLGNPAQLPAGTSPRSICGWGRSATTAGGFRWIAAYGSPAGGQAFFIGMNGTTLYGGGYGDDVTVANFWDANWHHIALTYDGTTARLYADGVERASAAKNWNLVRSLAYIGRQANPAAEYWNGQIDDVRIYNRVLSPAEITNMAAGQAGPAAPTGLAATPADGRVTLSWNPSATASNYNVKRSTTPGGPYTVIAQNLSAQNYLDMPLTNGTTYYYVVSGVSYGEGADSTEASATPNPPPVTALPNTGLQTNEGGATTQFTIRFNQAAPAAGSRVTVVSNDPGEGAVSTSLAGTTAVPGGFFFDVTSGTSPTVVITVTGVDDSLVDGAQPYTVSIAATNMAVTIPDVQLTNNDDDQPGISISRTSGITVSEGPTSDTFTVRLNSQPFGFIDLPLSSSVPGEAAVSPAMLRFTPTGNPTYSAATGVGDWNVDHVVTVTGVDDAVLDFAQAFTIVTGALQLSNAADNPAYAIDPSDVTGVNNDNEAIPTLPPVWGGGGNSSGCGLLGLEIALLVALLRLRRR